MPPNLQNLNKLYPPQQPHGDAQDLLSGTPFPDLTAQLDLWTNLSFDSDEGPLSRSDDDRYKKDRGEDDEEDNTNTNAREAAIHDGHTNVVTGTVLRNSQPGPVGPALPNPALFNHPITPGHPAFDMSSFFASFGIDPFTAAAAAANASNFANPQATTMAPSLAQILALHSMHANAYAHLQHPPLAPLPPSNALPLDKLAPVGSNSFVRPSASTSSSAAEEVITPPTKRARTRKSSVSTSASSDTNRGETPTISAAGTPTSGSSSLSASSSPTTVAPHAIAEDKRRRNTAASARFRAKKKEREAALEGKAKELETRVNELERECEGLRRENGWLKGLVVGVTGAAQGPVAVAAANGPTPAGTMNLGRSKRNRDEVEAA